MTARREVIGDCELWCGDCANLVAGVGPVDACVTDPPYNVGKRYSSYIDDFPATAYCDWLSGIFSSVQCVTLVYMPGDRHLWDAPSIVMRAGFEMGRPLAWHKKEFAGDKWAGGPPISWEPVIWAHAPGVRGFNKIFGVAGRDCLVVNATHGSEWAKVHPCPKPPEVCAWLVGLFVPEGGSCLDPFMGTGTFGVSCAATGRRYVGIEKDPGYFDTACRRIEAAYRQRDLFIEPSRKAPVQMDLSA